MNETWAERELRISKHYAKALKAAMAGAGHNTVSLGEVSGLGQQEVSKATSPSTKGIKSGKYFALMAAMGLSHDEIARRLALATDEAKEAGLFDVPPGGYKPSPRGKAAQDNVVTLRRFEKSTGEPDETLDERPAASDPRPEETGDGGEDLATESSD